MKKILYIHGYNGNKHGVSYQRIKKYAKGFDVVAIDYDQEKPNEAIRTILDYVYDNNIDLVIGSSLGGFLTMNCFDIPRVVINPCIMPVMELPKLGYKGPTSDYKILQKSLLNYKPDSLEKLTCIGCFGDNDELFGTKFLETFKSKGYKAYNIQSTHQISEKGAKQLMEVIVPEFLDNLSNISESIDKQDNNSHIF